MSVGLQSSIPEPPAWSPRLFSPEQALRLGQHQIEAPLLYARQRPPSSTSSEEVQAEVQRQLRNFVEKHDGEARRLREEVERLQEERDRLALEMEAVRGRASERHSVPRGDRSTEGRHSVPQGDRATEGRHSVPQGDRATEGRHSVPRGDRSTEGRHSVPRGDRASEGHSVPRGDRASEGHSVPRGDRASEGRNRLSQDNGYSRSSQNFSQATEYFDLQEGDRMYDDRQGNGEVEERPRRPPEAADEASTTPSTMELLGVIATGMRQLQEAQLRQLERKPDAPEVVKPGISSLPTLSAPGQDTSPVDIQDWLEEVGSVMTDLSDSSWEWWLQTKEVAEAHYRKWIKSTPMEKISLSVPKTTALEQGRYGRVNARAAGMILASLPQEVKSEMITKKVTGSTPSLIFKLLTAYRPGGEKEKTLLLQQLTAPDTAANAEEAVQGLRRWGRWHARAKDLTVTVPDPVLMIKGLAAIVATVLSRHQDVWLRTSMVRQKLQLDSNPTEEATLDYHKHLQAEMELLSTATNATRGGPRIKSAAATTDSTTVTTPSSASTPAAKPKAQPTKERPCKWFAKTDGGCRRGVDCQYAHDWGATQKAGRCLVCSSTAHMKKDCPVKEKGSSSKLQKPQKENVTSTTSTSSPAARALGTASEAAGSATSSPQPAGEPSPSTSPTTSRPRVPPEEERPDDLKQVLADASKMLKTMMATNASASTAASTAPPTYESLQKQLDELKLKSLKVTSEDPGRAEMKVFTEVPSYLEIQRQLDQRGLKAVKVDEPQVEQGQGTLLDSGSTHVLRPARSEDEKRESRSVYVTLAGDEQRLLSQAPSGSIIIEATNDDAVQSIIPFGKVIEVLRCTLKWTRGGFYLHHPKHGRIKTRVKSGCPEITDAGQAAAIIAELEMKKVSQLKEKTQELQNQLCAIRMMEQKKEDWRIILSKYAEHGDAAEGLQAIYLSPSFQGVPNHVRVSMAPSLDTSPKAGWEYLKLLPLPRRVRKRLFKSNNWVLNMFAGEDIRAMMRCRRCRALHQRPPRERQ